MFTIVGLGYEENNITLGAVEAITNSKCLVVKTDKYKVSKFFAKKKIEHITLDDVYCSVSDYDMLNSAICDRLLELHNTNNEVCYAVGGSGLDDKSVKVLLERLLANNIEYKLIVGIGYGERAIADCKKHTGVATYISATDYIAMRTFSVNRNSTLAITEVYDRYIASEVKLKLLMTIGEDTDVMVIMNDKSIATKVVDIDQIPRFSYDATIVIEPQNLITKQKYNFDDLVDIMYRLRDPDGCAWDKTQTHKSIRANVVEEAYELVEAIDLDDIDKMIEETGDVLLQSVFHSVMAEGLGEFDSSEVMTVLCKKLIFRHTHIFGNVKANTAEEALIAWENAKKEEKNQKTIIDKIKSIAEPLPSLMKANKIQKIAKKCGFDWKDPLGAIEKVKEELCEIQSAKEEEREMECGDLLFAVVNVCRLYGYNPEIALNRANTKFVKRIEYMENKALENGDDLSDYSIERQEELWIESKKLYK